MSSSVDVRSDFGCERCGSLSCGRRNSVHGVAVLGAKGVGKSALVVQLMTHRFIHEYDSSADCLYQTKVPVGDHCTTLKILDATSTTKVDSLDLTAYEGIMLVYSVTDSSSLKAALDIKWEVDKCLQRQQIRRKPRFLLVANKSDLSHIQCVSELEGKQAAAILGCEFVMLAARGHWNKVEKGFQILVEKIRVSKRQQRRHHWTMIVDQVISNRGSSIGSSDHNLAAGAPTHAHAATPQPQSHSRDSLLNGDGDEPVAAKSSSLKRVIKRVSSFNLKRAGTPRRGDRKSASFLDNFMSSGNDLHKPDTPE